MMLHAVEGMMSIVIIILLGMFISWRKWADASAGAFIARIVMNLCIPLFMVVSLTEQFDRERLLAMAHYMAVPVLAMLLAFLLGTGAVHLFRVPSGRRGIFKANYFVANSMFIGLPVNLILFGDRAVAPVMIYYFVNTLMFWTLGAQGIIRDGSVPGARDMSFFQPAMLKKILSVPLLGFLAGVALVLFNIHLPPVLARSFHYIGSMTTPLSLLFIGMEIYHIPLKELHFSRDMTGSLLGRFLISPLCVMTVLSVIPVDPLAGQVFVVEAFMPAMTQTAILARMYGSDAEYASMVSLVTVVAGLVAIPAYMYGLTKFWGI